MGSCMNSLTQSIWDHVEKARSADSLAELSAVASRYACAEGFNYYGFALKFPKHARSDPESYHNFHNIPGLWGGYRYETTYASDAADQDPLILHLRAGLPPTAFSSTGLVTHTRPDIGRRSTSILQRAGEHGLNAGICVPLSGPNVRWGFMVMTTGDTRDVRDVLPALPNFHFFAHYVHCSARQVLENCRPSISISAREKEILRWAAVGKTSWEIGRITSLSERTVNFHLQAAARKLEVSGRQAACARALVLGLITI
jgi:DNA-binding CsgD family transcriptional regulator